MDEIDKLIKHKKSEGLSYEAIARMIGVTLSTVYRWMKRERRPNAGYLLMIDSYLKRNGKK